MNLKARISSLLCSSLLMVACGDRGDGGTGGSNGKGGGSCAPFCGTGGSGGSGGSPAGGGGGGATGGGNPSTGGGNGGASGGGSGGSSGFDAGQAASAKRAKFCDAGVELRGVIVAAVQDETFRDGGQYADVRTNFWVIDPGNPKQGLYVFKDYLDKVNGATDAGVVAGDIVNINGILSTIRTDSFINEGAEAYRYNLVDGCNSSAPPLAIIVTGHQDAPAPIAASNPFGQNPDGGRPKGNTTGDQRFIQDIAGGRVKIPGPLTLSNATPVEMKRPTSSSTDHTYLGFEVSGSTLPAGVLVRTAKMKKSLPDGGNCDYRVIADGGQSVTFPDGITGVWDTFSQTACKDGNATCTGSNARNDGVVPGLGSKYTFVLEPLSCDDLSPAVIQ